MKKNRVAMIFIVGTFFFLAGCIGIAVDEARVFQPQPIANKAKTVEEMHIDFEDVFTRPGNYTFTNNINSDHSTIRLFEDDFIAADLRHGFWADGTIAVTEFITGRPDKPLVVHCGGNSSDRYGFGAFFGLKVLPYADLVIFDYPGFGDSPGVPSAQSFEAMVAHLAGELNARSVQYDRPIILWGYSLGGFVCSELLQSITRVDAIIIESSASSAKSASRHLVPRILRPFLKVHLSPTLADYDNVEALKNFKGQIVVLAGAEDGILPATLSRELVAGLEELGVAVTYHEFAGGNHANLPTLGEYKATLSALFSQWAPLDRR